MSYTSIPIAFKGDKSSLSAQAREEINSLTGARPLAFAGRIAAAWIVIALSVYSAVSTGNPLVYALAIFLIATRMNMLGLLIHDQAHLSGFRGKWGDAITNIFCAYPLLGITVESYAQLHLAHHRDYFGKDDPDFSRKHGPEFSFPMNTWSLVKLFLRDLTGLSIVQVVKGKKSSAHNPVFVRKNPSPTWLRPVFMIALLSVVTYLGIWPQFLLLWVIPIITVLTAIVRWGAICEHIYLAPGASVEESSPLIMPGPIARLLLPNLNFTLHAYHHWHPGVSFSELPRVHSIYRREGLVNEEAIFHGYWSYWQFLTAKQTVLAHRA